MRRAQGADLTWTSGTCVVGYAAGGGGKEQRGSRDKWAVTPTGAWPAGCRHQETSLLANPFVFLVPSTLSMVPLLPATAWPCCTSPALLAGRLGLYSILYLMPRWLLQVWEATGTHLVAPGELSHQPPRALPFLGEMPSYWQGSYWPGGKSGQVGAFIYLLHTLLLTS